MTDMVNQMKRNCLSLIFGIFFAFFILRSYFLNGLFPGDALDARSTIFIYEHWWAFFQGKEGLSELSYFKPEPNWLGASETFILNGIPYSLARFFGFPLLESWVIANFVLLFVGAVGLYLFLGKIFNRTSSVVFTCLLVTFSYQLNTQMVHPQTYTFFLSFWVFYFCLNLRNSESFRFNFFGLIFSSSLLLLGAWYALVFTILISVILLILALGLPRKTKSLFAAHLSTHLTHIFSGKPHNYLIFIFPLLSLSIFLKIYWDLFRNSSFGAFEEVVFYSPRLFDLLNASLGSFGYSEKVYKALNLGTEITFERTMGFPIIFLCFMLLVVIASLLVTNMDIKFRVFTVLALFLTLTPLADERGQSAWYFFWLTPIGDSIRTPARFWVFAQVIWAILIVMFLERAVKKIWTGKKYILVLALVCSIICFDQYRMPLAKFDGQILTPFGQRALASLKDQDCEYFYLGADDTLDISDSLNRQVDAIAVAYATAKETINGYSSQVPDYWPQSGAWGLVDPESVIKYVKSYKGTNGKSICFYSENGLRIIKVV